MSRDTFAHDLFVAALVAVVLIGTPLTSSAGPMFVDFETIPGGARRRDGDQQSIWQRDLRTRGRGFAGTRERGGFPTGFFGPPQDTAEDQLAPGTDSGEFFLTDDGIIGLPPKIVVITFNDPVRSAGGNLLDVDGGEMWTVEARDANGQLNDSETLTSADPDAGDGMATPFLFSHPTSDIASLHFTYAGTKQNVGFGFDSLSFDQLVGSRSPSAAGPLDGLGDARRRVDGPRGARAAQCAGRA